MLAVPDSLSDSADVERLRAVHVAYSELLILLFTRDRGPKLKAKTALIERAALACEAAVTEWLAGRWVNTAQAGPGV